MLNRTVQSLKDKNNINKIISLTNKESEILNNLIIE